MYLDTVRSGWGCVGASRNLILRAAWSTLSCAAIFSTPRACAKRRTTPLTRSLLLAHCLNLALQRVEFQPLLCSEGLQTRRAGSCSKLSWAAGRSPASVRFPWSLGLLQCQQASLSCPAMPLLGAHLAHGQFQPPKAGVQHAGAAVGLRRSIGHCLGQRRLLLVWSNNKQCSAIGIHTSCTCMYIMIYMPPGYAPTSNPLC